MTFELEVSHIEYNKSNALLLTDISRSFKLRMMVSWCFLIGSSVLEQAARWAIASRPRYRTFVSLARMNRPRSIEAFATTFESGSRWIARLIASNKTAFWALLCWTFRGVSCDMSMIACKIPWMVSVTCALSVRQLNSKKAKQIADLVVGSTVAIVVS